MNLIRVDDFSLVDIIDPKSKRIKLLLSTVINFLKHRENELNNFKEYIDKNVSRRGGLIEYYRELGNNVEKLAPALWITNLNEVSKSVGLDI